MPIKHSFNQTNIALMSVEKINDILIQMGYDILTFTCPKIYFAWLKLALLNRKSPDTALKFDLLAGSQHSMLFKHGFNQPIIALISVQKYLIFLLKWIFHMSKNIFYSIKTCALISNSLFCSVDLVTFSPAVNTQCQSNVASITDHWAHMRGKIIEIVT